MSLQVSMLIELKISFQPDWNLTPSANSIVITVKEVVLPLVSMVTELKKAQAGHYAVPLFDTVEMKGFEGTLAAQWKGRCSCPSSELCRPL
jgi:hypothetical protein